MGTSESKCRADIDGLLRTMRGRAPRTPDTLWEFIRCYYRLAIPRRRVCPHHVAPFDYVWASYSQSLGDLVVWANRGGAKTELGSVTSHLDSLFRPGCQTRILGGSLQQSERMYEYLTAKWHPHFADQLASEPRSRRTELRNKATIEILTQSERSVRGQRVQRVKCDEVDEFDVDVWRAVQFITQSRGGIRSSLEAFSTMHRAYGLMSEVVGRATDVNRLIYGGPRGDSSTTHPQTSLWVAPGAPHHDSPCHGGSCPPCGKRDGQKINDHGHASVGMPPGGEQSMLLQAEAWHPAMPPGNGTEEVIEAPPPPAPAAAGEEYGSRTWLFAWCLWETIEQCTSDRSCSRCSLSEDCQGRARNADGFIRIDDALGQMRRSGREAWETEMLCHRPRQDRLVFGRFSRDDHVRSLHRRADAPVYRSLDFGFANPFVCLWAQVVGDDDETARIEILDEYVQSQRTIAEHVNVLASRPWPIRMTFCDPAGRQRDGVTGRGECEELRRHGILTKSCTSGIIEGVDAVRALLRPALGDVRLLVDGRCERLIRALESYHYGPSGGGSELPEKDGVHDHLIDALRYLVVNLFRRRSTIREVSYW